MKTKFEFFSLLILGGVLFFFGTTIVLGEEFRTFSNKEGAEIRATLLELIGDESIQIKRESDGEIFVLKVDDLSLNDQEYVALLIKERAKSDRAKKKSGSCQVTLPHYMEYVLPMTNRPLLAHQESAFVQRFVVPHGTWMHYDPFAVSGRFLIPYLGEKKWVIEVSDGRVISLTRDGSEPETIGISLKDSESDAAGNEAALQTLNLESVKNVLNVSFENPDDLHLLELLPPGLPLSLVTSEILKPEDLKFLSQRNLIALEAKLSKESLSILSKLGALQHLGLEVTDLEPGDRLELPSLPQLKHLAMLNGSGQIDWPSYLTGLPNLQSLAVLQKSGRFELSGVPINDFDSNRNLKMLISHSRGDRQKNTALPGSAIVTATNLEHLQFWGIQFARKKSYYQTLTKLTELKSLNVQAAIVPDGVYEKWFNSGNLSKLIHLGADHLPDFQNTPKLEILRITRTEETDFTRFEAMPDSLRILTLSQIEKSDFQKIHLSSPENIVGLNVSAIRFESPEIIYQFTNISSLNFWNVDGAITEIDISRFPKLTTAVLRNAPALKSIKGINNHQNLVNVSISNMPLLRDLGASAANNTLRSLTLAKLPALSDLNAFDGLVGLESFSLIDCDAIGNYDKIQQNNQLRQISIHDCDLLKPVFFDDRN